MSSSALRDYISRAHQQQPNSSVLTALEIDAAGLNLPDEILRITLAAFSDCLRSDDKAAVQCQCESSSRWRPSSTTEPMASPCLILAQRGLAASGLMQYLLSGIKSESDDLLCGWMIRLSYALDVIQTSPIRCQAISANPAPYQTPTWNNFYEALLAREVIGEAIMAVFFELLVNRIASTESQRIQGCQARFVRAPWVIPVVIRLLQKATLAAWRLAMSNFAFLFENEPNNVDVLATMKNWQESLIKLMRLPEVGVLSCRKSDNFLELIGDDNTIFNFKMLINIFSMAVMRHLWNKRDGTRAVLRQITESVEKEFGYGDIESIAIIRVIFYVLCNRFRHFSVHQVQRNPVALPNAIKLVESVEQFVFYNGGLSKYCMDYRDIMLHIALDGKANADKELLSAVVHLCEFIFKNAVPKDIPSASLPSETRTMLMIIMQYLALLSDAACLFATPTSSNALLESAYLLKKTYLQAGIGQKSRKSPSPVVKEDYELSKAMRYQLAEEIEAKYRAEYEQENRTMAYRRISVNNHRKSTEVSSPTISPRSGARRMTFLVENFGSLEAAMNAAERYSGRIRYVFRVEKDYLKTKKGDADNMLPVSKGNLISILSLDMSTKSLLASLCNKIGFVHKSCLSQSPVGFEVDVPIGKHLPISLSSPTPNTLLTTANSIISPIKVDDRQKCSSVVLESQKEIDSLPTLYRDSSLMQTRDSVLPVLEITAIPERDVMAPDSLVKRKASLGKQHHDSIDSAYKSMDFNVDALHLNSARSGNSRSLDMSMELIAEMNSVKSGFTGVVTQYSSRSPTKDSAVSGLMVLTSGEHPSKMNFGFAVRTQEEQCELINAEVVLSMLELGVDLDSLPSEIQLDPSLVEIAKSKIQQPPFDCELCGKVLSNVTDVHRIDRKKLCANDYLNESRECEVCNDKLEDLATTKRLISGSRIHISCAVCSECPEPAMDSEGADISWQGLLYCKMHFLSLFWKSCSACDKAITGTYTDVASHPYHRQCICCSVCKISLNDDSKPVIMLPNSNKIYCENDARECMLDQQCGLCLQEIWEDDWEDSIRIFPYRFHLNCVSCTICGSAPSKATYAENPFYLTRQDPVIIVCSLHSSASKQNECPQCGKKIESEAGKAVIGSLCYHVNCVHCTVCKMSLVHRTIYRHSGKLMCRADYDAWKIAFGTDKKEPKRTICESCGQEIRSSRDGVKIKGKKLHQACVKCSVCNEQLGVIGQIVYIHRRRVLCSVHYNEARAANPDSTPSSILASCCHSSIDCKQFRKILTGFSLLCRTTLRSHSTGCITKGTVVTLF